MDASLSMDGWNCLLHERILFLSICNPSHNCLRVWQSSIEWDGGEVDSIIYAQNCSAGSFRYCIIRHSLYHSMCTKVGIARTYAPYSIEVSLGCSLIDHHCQPTLGLSWLGTEYLLLIHIYTKTQCCTTYKGEWTPSSLLMYYFIYHNL